MATTQLKPFVFLSFASSDDHIAAMLHDELEQAGVQVFYAKRDIPGGYDWMKVIDEKLPNLSCILVPIYSKDYFGDDRRSVRELRSFVELRDWDLEGRLAPIRLDKAEVDPLFQTIQWKDFDRNNFSASDAVDYILASCSKELRITPEQSSKIAMRIKTRYEEVLREEFAQIQSRVADMKQPPESTSRVKIFGWLAVCGFAKPIPNPLISAVELKIKYRALSAAYFDDRQGRFIDLLGSFRYLLYCYCVAVGVKDFTKGSLYDPLVQGLVRPIDDPRSGFRELREQTEKLIKNPNLPESIEQCASLLNLVGRIAASISVDVEKLYLEETSSSRHGVAKERQITTARENAVTHEIEIYFLDRKGSYLFILDHLYQLQLNLLRTITETLSPGRVAKASLLVNFRAPNLESKVRGIVDENDELREVVLEYFVRELRP